MQLAHRSAAAAPRCVPRCPAQRPSLRVRSASPAVNLTAEVEQAADTQTHVVALTGAEYEAFIAANEAVLIDYYTECVGTREHGGRHFRPGGAQARAGQGWARQKASAGLRGQCSLWARKPLCPAQCGRGQVSGLLCTPPWGHMHPGRE
jgi:hypothetical protein